MNREKSWVYVEIVGVEEKLGHFDIKRTANLVLRSPISALYDAEVQLSRTEGVPLAENDRSVFRRPDGTWVNKLNEAGRASSLHDTQREANQAAAEMLRNAGGGERTTMGLNGQIVSKDTIGKSDPCPAKDTEH